MHTQRTYIAYLDKNQLVDNMVEREQYKNLPNFPAISRDISFVLPKDIMVKKIENVLRPKAQ